MARILCNKCHQNRGIFDEEVNCAEVDGRVKLVLRKDVKGGNYENCPQKLAGPSPCKTSQLYMLSFLTRFMGRIKNEQFSERAEPLTRDEIKTLESQVRERSGYMIAIAD